MRDAENRERKAALIAPRVSRKHLLMSENGGFSFRSSAHKQCMSRAKMLRLLSLGSILLSIGTYYFFLVTYGSGNPIGVETRSESFDSLGHNLLEFRADVDPHTINWEGFDINGKKYMYFGPFPALMRIIFNFVHPDFYGQ